MIKRSLVITLVLIFILALVACSQGTSSQGTGGQEASSGSGSSASTKTGVLIEASMHVISIQAPDGSTYTFGIDDDTDIEGSEVLGNTMSVTYEGEYTSGIIAKTILTVTEAPQTSASGGKGSTDAPGAPQPKEPAPAQERIWYLTGTVTDVSMNQLQLLYEDGKTYTVLKDDNTKTDSGIVVGCVARVFHKGSLKSGMLATEIHFIADAPPPAGDPVYFLTGTVTDASMHQLQLLYEDGVVYTILKDDNTRTDSGIEVGSTVRVFHKGHLTEEMLATEIRLISNP